MERGFVNSVFIGDNLAVMESESFKKTYTDKVSLIYIDPPYNTKNCFSYNDNLSSCDWIKFMRSRIETSLQFLKENGVMFISIDDSEYARLKLLCDEIFGGANCIGTLITNQAMRSNAKHINTVHEYVLCYAKNKSKVKPFEILRKDIPSDAEMIESLSKKIKTEFNKNGVKAAEKLLFELIKKYCMERNITWLQNYSNVSEDGEIYFAKDLSVPGKPREISIPEINLKLPKLKTRGWVSDKKFIELYKQKRLVFKGDRPYHIHYLSESKDSAPSILNFYSRQGTEDLKKLGLGGIFDTPKPTEMIKYFIKLTCRENDLVMDYFAGCGTTGQAVYEINKENKWKLNFVLIQKEEKVNRGTEVYERCLANGILPNIASILEKRLKTYLKKNESLQEFSVIKI